MAEWIYFIHPARDNFAETMTPEEEEVWRVHFARLRRLLDEGVMVLVGPTLGPVNTGIGELRPFRISLLRGRDGAPA